MTMSPDAAVEALRAAGEPTRLRILSLLGLAEGEVGHGVDGGHGRILGLAFQGRL